MQFLSFRKRERLQKTRRHVGYEWTYCPDNAFGMTNLKNCLRSARQNLSPYSSFRLGQSIHRCRLIQTASTSRSVLPCLDIFWGGPTARTCQWFSLEVWPTSTGTMQVSDVLQLQPFASGIEWDPDQQRANARLNICRMSAIADVHISNVQMALWAMIRPFWPDPASCE
jgi:hypothetical protein